MTAISYVLSRWPLAALAISAAMLAAAHAFQTFGGLAPCHLCLKQREVYWAALAIAGVGAVLRFTPLRVGRLVCAVLAVAFLCGAALAVYHAGAEWKFWPGPASCSGGLGSVDAADLTRLLQGAAMRPPSCDKAAWVFLGLSMAGWNALFSLGLASASALSARSVDR